MYSKIAKEKCHHSKDGGKKINPAALPKSKQLRKKKVHILNFIDFERRNCSNPVDRMTHTRQGASRDSENLRATFERIGYEVSLRESLTQNETDDYLDDIQEDMSLKELVLIILSHGRDDDKFITSDYQEYSLTEIQYRFNDSNCRHLAGCSKVILANFCRGEIREFVPIPIAGDHNVPQGEEEPPHNMILINASHEGFAAMRNTTSGTVFVKNLCEVLNEERYIPLHEVFNDMYYKIRNDKGQTPELKVSAPFPIFYF